MYCDNGAGKGGTGLPAQDGTGMEICNANCACARNTLHHALGLPFDGTCK